MIRRVHEPMEAPWTRSSIAESRAGQNRRSLAVASLVAALVLGGGGSPAPLAGLALQLVTAVIMLVWLCLGTPPRIATPVRVLAAIAIVLPALQLVPLPPWIWQSLPGRESLAGSLALVGAQENWWPISVAPMRTLAVLLALGPPLAVLLMTAALPPADRTILLAAIATAGFAGVLLGAVQLAQGTGTGARLYPSGNTGWLTGLQASRNAAADMLLIAMVALAAFASTARQTRRHARRDQHRSDDSSSGNEARTAYRVLAPLVVLAIVFGMFVPAVLMTGSRAGIVLLVPALFLVAVLTVPDLAMRRHAVRNAVILATGGAGAAFLAFRLPSLQMVAARFDFATEFRLQLWSDAAYAAQQAWPVGFGMGTFMPVAIAYEPLETVDLSVPNRAHNDYLELLVEAGGSGIAVLLASGAIVAFLLWRAWRNRLVPQAHVLFTSGVLVILAAHSLVDYPLRSSTLLCVFACAIGMLAPAPISGTARQAAPDMSMRGDLKVGST
ncbi:O-antigen ligase family protein [Croceicoccus sp. F390]|uniref:O-antigen ligase family protein n=1 Tax=Croceicoccus esteveae TaxID=3075597 RepID=A0ABU2ZHR9_9SPHN|nr:O-antigen ligase family protein [Croceicoccus sp. F390]MDT0575736.1 O-antigen ligase family protein [Croceicoccus sp. F390]